MSAPAQQGGGVALSPAQRIAWLRLTRTESIGPLTFNTLVNRHGGADAALEALPDLLRARGRGDIRIPTVAEAEAELERAERMGARLVAMGEAAYPPLLKTVAGAPPLLAILGKAEVFRLPLVAIVGARNASGAGRSMADRMAQGLVRAGYGIVSGLARGIDTRAHEASLAFGTVGVLAGGLDRPYPPENVGLMQKIAETGAVVSEMPFGWEPRGRDFPRRNRIISGLSYATVLVEAALKSGSLITARFALEQGREVFAVPGSPLDPRAEGTNDLIRRGNAHFCTSADDVISELLPIVQQQDLFAVPRAREGASEYATEPLWDELLDPAASRPMGLEEPASEPPLPEDAPARIESLLGPAPLEVDELARLSGLPLRQVQAVLTDLDLAGRLERHGGNRISLVVPAT